MAKKPTSRDDELSKRPAIVKKLLEVFRDIEKGFADQNTRADDILDYWDIYNCNLGEKQFYNGNSKIFVPIVHNAIKARKTRFTNQIFPQSGRYVEVTTENGDIPHATMALAEHYVRRAQLRTRVMPALMVAGDVEGQYNLYAAWKTKTRHVASKDSHGVEVSGLDFPELGKVETIVKEEIEDGYTDVEVLSDSDVLILPATSDSPEDAIEQGGSATVLRRWTKATIRRMIDDGEFEESAGEALLKNMAKKNDPGRRDIKKQLATDAGIMSGNSGKYAQGYETWTKLKVDGEYRICRAYYGGDDQILGAKLNPYWSDLVPLISSPVDKMPGVAKGISQIKPGVMDMQILANDMCNEGADTAHFSAMPIIMTDPEKNPKVGTMILGLAAVWETSPKDTQFAQFPPLWEKTFEVIAKCSDMVEKTLGVNPAMIPQSTGGPLRKRNQAEVANEQQVDILTTADAVTVIEESVLTPLIQRMVEYDAQFRDKDILVRSFGEMGMRATMETIEPIQMNRRFEFRWFGVEAARNAAQIQQQIAYMNVLKSIPPEMYPGYKLNMVPIITQGVESTFGPRLAPLIFEDMKSKLATDPEQENQLLMQGFEMPVHEMDDDQKHLMVHQQALAQGDPTMNIRAHMQFHIMALQQKSQQMQQPQGLPGSPGGAGPGAAGTPRPGAQPQGPRLIKGPEGMIAPESMPRAGAVQMPRKM